MADFVTVVLAGKVTRYSAKPRDTSKLTQGRLRFRRLKVRSNKMDPAEIRFVRKAFIKERGAEVFRKIGPSFILGEHFKDSAPPFTGVGTSNNGLPTRE
jgi:hypothetical protein